MKPNKPWWQARIRELPLTDLAFLAETFAALLQAKIALRIFPSKQVLARYGRPLTQATAPTEQTLHRIRWAVLAVARRAPIRFVCFPQCLAAATLLRRAGIPSTLHYGIRRDPATNQLETHTWLEAAGQILIGGELAPTFTTLATYTQTR